MTVVVWDGKIIAADKQASQGDLKSLTTKIRRSGGGDILAWTGACENGMALADWYERGADSKEWPVFQKDAESWCRLIVASGGKVFTYEQLPVKQFVEEPFAAWGSGRDYALGALAMGANAVKAVKVASEFSTSCGLGVDSFKVGIIRAAV